MAEEIKKFYRSRTDRVLFGVCGGLGKYFGVDPILFRLAFVALLIADGTGILLYLIMVFATPEEPGRSDTDKDLEGEVDELANKIEKKAEKLSEEIQREDQDNSGRTILGALIILLGIFLFFRNVFPVIGVDKGIIGAVAIIAIGIIIAFKK